MIKKVTSYTIHQTAEGVRASYTYSIIDESGNLIKSNQRETVILLDEQMLDNAKSINEFLVGKIPE